MPHKYIVFFKIIAVLVALAVSGNGSAYSPPASLPLEPASPDEEVISQGDPIEVDIERPAPRNKPKEPRAEVKAATQKPRPSRARDRSLDERVEDIQRSLAGEAPSSSRTSLAQGSEKRASRHSLAPSEPGAGDFSAQARFSLNADGFGGAVKLVQYPKTWLGVTETFRYFKNEDEERLFLNRRGVLVGLEIHPWRSVLISPFADIQGGWESFEREGELDNLKSAVFEAAAGLELRLTNFASVVAQWTEANYPALREPLFYPGKTQKDPRRFQTAEVLFNLKWEKNLF